ncbi:MAG TPA: glycosyltransferase family 39 protein [Bryobacteraceae bacterium]|nr:glycosyltransferase family 39 protein [Bryobacteraceae bacterium]
MAKHASALSSTSAPEPDSHAPPASRSALLIVALVVLALRLPFLNQAMQGDDVLYLTEAAHAQVEPLHPKHTEYVFMGRDIDMRGQSHPPFNAWFLALLIALGGGVSEIPFHAAYILFSLIAAFGALALARRFSPHPLLATLLFCATPAFVINGTSLEADVPFVALWLLSTALYIYAVDCHCLSRLILASLAMALTALTAYQSILLVPILLLYGRKWRAAQAAALTPIAMLVSWQLFERATTGALPAGVLAGYMSSYGLQVFAQKIKSAVALTGHLAWLVFPTLWLPPLYTIPVAIGAFFYDWNPLFWGSITVGVGILVSCARRWRDFLAQWVLIFFAGALVIFFAGSARYLLPIALPIAILATQRINLRLLKISTACGFALSIALAVVNYQHWNGYRDFARSLATDAQTKRLWINGEWGLRYYLGSEGGLPLHQGQAIHPGEMVVSSKLSYPIPFSSGGGVLAPVAQRVVTSPIPLRIVALNSRAAYSTTMFGLRPFDISLAPIDQLSAELMIERKPSLTDLPMNAPKADQQIVSGVYQLESGQWRWMSKTATILLKPPPQPTALTISFTIPDVSPVRQLTVALDNKIIATQTFPTPGVYSLTGAPLQPTGDTAQITITADKSFSVPGDSRELSVILSDVGFR